MRSKSDATTPTMVAAPNAPAPLSAPGTANVALCNFIGQTTVFRVSGSQGGAVVTRDVDVLAFSYVWSTGWDAGENKILTVTTPFFVKTFSPFVTSDLVPLFKA